MDPVPHYLEIVTPDVDGTCRYYEQTFGFSFEADDQLGGARVAVLPNEARVGVRAPMRDDEGPLWRVYMLVADLRESTDAARKAGAAVALDSMELGGHGRISIVLVGGIEHGLWELPKSPE
jgi:predicted enzyme related to lactoylglutathione lyase